MSPFRSGLFPGHVTHARMKPKPHRLAYRIYPCSSISMSFRLLMPGFDCFPSIASICSRFITGTGVIVPVVICAGRSRRPCARWGLSRMAVRSCF